MWAFANYLYMIAIYYTSRRVDYFRIRFRFQHMKAEHPSVRGKARFGGDQLGGSILITLAGIAYLIFKSEIYGFIG